MTGFLMRLTAGATLTLLSLTNLAASNAEKTLKLRSAEFNQEVIQVAADTYTAVGFGVSPTSMIVGERGLVIIDTQIDENAANAVLSEFRKITNKPVQAIVLTHAHGDHTGGAAVFAAAGDNVQIWAREPFDHENATLAAAQLTIQKQRGARQGGFLLAPEQRINNGVAQVYFPQRGSESFGAAAKPTHYLGDARQQIQIADIELDLVPATGETYDELYIWHSKERVLFAGDNFYKSWPNLYAIRGTPYRDVLAWINSLTSMLEEKPKHLVGGHTRPIIGQQNTTATLTNYRDAIKSIFDQTIAGMNKGLTPNELVQTVKLPAKYAELDYLKEYYGNIEWSVRAIFTGYLGWFDGNATSLFPLSDAEEARRVAALAGGKSVLLKQARSAVSKSPQWAAQLCDYLLALNYKVGEVRDLKADALEALGAELLTATGRNYYFSQAKELRKANQNSQEELR